MYVAKPHVVKRHALNPKRRIEHEGIDWLNDRGRHLSRENERLSEWRGDIFRRQSYARRTFNNMRRIQNHVAGHWRAG